VKQAHTVDHGSGLDIELVVDGADTFWRVERPDVMFKLYSEARSPGEIIDVALRIIDVALSQSHNPDALRNETIRRLSTGERDDV
jgi:hypothetical protein